MDKLIKELREAKKSKISSWIDSVSIRIEKMELFFKTASKVGLIKDGFYISGIPKGSEEYINDFYKLENELEYPKPQKIN
ncbi:hypothetical protein M1M25_gp011 [Tenacibaculum phage Gundel_1]|uniref:Uncharacterized protein n=1 Tax=Tenacibaculum phage Gundel_1 TaxID=2745672 RepID=A0A8E4ZDW5_9CAUD|nr:hypothetical protein M1M25_gp011 [Tenacibaculum phage Gundel_1]QQV91432.1 hypothetical protein Gundel1_11 [Tenacibaculum phage Gundel_1]